MNLVDFLGQVRRRRFAGVERGSRALQVDPNVQCERVRATKHASRSPFQLLEDIHGLAEIVEGGVVIPEERRRVNRPHLERVNMTRTENTSCHGHRFAQQRLGFFEAVADQGTMRS